MSFLQAIFLGLIQGITEFLPISSSGHLNFFRSALGISLENNTILFDLFCHVATVVAVILFLGKSISKYIQEKRWFVCIFISLLPLLPTAAFKKNIESIYTDPSNLFFFYLITGVILFLGYLKTKQNYFPIDSISKISCSHALIIGFAQMLAIFPGISRSGMTICSALFCGLSPQIALTYSLLLAIPTILGVTSIQLLELIFSNPTSSTNLYDLSIPIAGAVFTALTFGYLALFLLRWSLYSCRFHMYACYCFLFSLLCYYLINFS